MRRAASKDGTTITCDRTGTGPSVILVGGDPTGQRRAGRALGTACQRDGDVSPNRRNFCHLGLGPTTRAFPGCQSPIAACTENLYHAVDAWEPIAAGFAAQFYVGDDEASGVGRSPVAKQVFPDMTGPATATQRHITIPT